MDPESLEAHGTQAESSGGAGAHPHYPSEGEETGDAKVTDVHEAATRELREEREPARTRERPPETTSGG